MAVVAGAVFVVFQLRQNARLINATIQENKAGIAFSMFERIIDDSFVRRRKNVYDSVKKYGERNWEGSSAPWRISRPATMRTCSSSSASS